MNSIALRMLLGDTTKFLALVFGLTFSATLVIQQGSIFTGILRRAGVAIETVPQADIWVMHPAATHYDARRPIEDTALQRVQGIEGVEWAQRLYVGGGSAQLPDGSFTTVQIIGVERQSKLGLPEKTDAAQAAQLETQDGVLWDGLGMSAFQHIRDGDVLQVNDRRARIGAVVQGPRSFAGMPSIYTTYDRAVELAPGERKRLTFVLVHVRPGFNHRAVARSIESATGLGAKTASEFFWSTVFFFMRNTGIALNFAVTISLGLIVGIAVAGQTFYTFTNENIKHFASLKAMGIGRRSLVRMVLLQALVVGLIGWGLGCGIAAMLGANMSSDSVLAFLLTPHLLLASGVTTMVTVFGAAALSIRRVLHVEPALVFK
jgi:putative ABC transport system permease protein